MYLATEQRITIRELFHHRNRAQRLSNLAIASHEKLRKNEQSCHKLDGTLRENKSNAKIRIVACDKAIRRKISKRQNSDKNF